MHWEERLLAVFDDLEQQAEGLALGARDAEVAELGRAEYAAVDVAARLHGALGSRLRLTVTGLGALDGRLARVGSDWLLLDTGTHEWLVRLDALAELRGLGERALDQPHRPPTARRCCCTVRMVRASAAYRAGWAPTSSSSPTRRPVRWS